jgi:hypothetical protein
MDYDVGELVEMTFAYRCARHGVTLLRGMTILLVEGPDENDKEIIWTVLSPYGIITDIPQRYFDYVIPSYSPEL